MNNEEQKPTDTEKSSTNSEDKTCNQEIIEKSNDNLPEKNCFLQNDDHQMELIKQQEILSNEENKNSAIIECEVIARNENLRDDVSSSSSQSEDEKISMESSSNSTDLKELSTKTEQKITRKRLKVFEEITKSPLTISVNPTPEIDKNMVQNNEIISNVQQEISSNSIEEQVTMLKPLQLTSLGAIASQYDSESETESEHSSCDSIQILTDTRNHRESKVIISSDSDTDSDVEIVSQINTPARIIEIDDDEEETGGKQKGPIRGKGELFLEDLPPIHDLHITVPEEECIELGKIHSIVEQIVLIDCIPGTAALDLDTVLFLEKGQKVLGEVFDVIGQVSSPLYCVRFNTNKEIQEKCIQIGQTVYVAPRTKHTHFLILSNLMSIRGSDASWEDDMEPPEKHLEYSDDEEERNARKTARNRKQPTEDTDANKRQKSFTRPQQSQNYRDHRQRYQNSQQQYSSPSPVFSSHDITQSPSFQYNNSNPSWHTNYASTSDSYPNAYARPEFMSPTNSAHNYMSQNFNQHGNQNINRQQMQAPFQYSPANNQNQTQQYAMGFGQQQMVSPQQFESNSNRLQFGAPNYTNQMQFSSPPFHPPPKY